MSNWTYIGAAGVNGHNATSVTIAGLMTPQAGDLCVVSWFFNGTSGVPSGTGITDTGSAGWSILSPLITNAASDFGAPTGAQCWWKVATAADFNGGSGVTVTISWSATAANATFALDVFRLTSGTVVGVDLVAAFNGGSQGTTQSVSPAAGSTQPSNSDELAWTANNAQSLGATTGSNTFTGTSSAAALSAGQIGGPNFVTTQYLLGCQASATAGTNIFKNTWTNLRTPMLFGATFYATGGAQQVMIV